METIWGFWRIKHRRYEEMCVLAATAQLGGAQMCELNEHVATCNSCREFLESIAQISVQTMPVLADSYAPAGIIMPPEGMRSRFLSRIAAEELMARGDTLSRPYPIPVQKPHPVSLCEGHGVEKTLRAERKISQTRSNVFPFLWRPAIALATCAAISIGTFYLGGRKVSPVPQEITQSHSSIASTPQQHVSMDDSSSIRKLELQKSHLENTRAELERKLEAAKAEQALLRDEIAAKDRLAAFTAQVRNTPQTSLEESKETKDRMALLQNEVDRLNQSLAESEVKRTVQEQMVQELTSRLDATESDLQREYDLKSAKSELGDLVAARNLHIVDVYDADPNGKRQRSFGRVFYIEGKSLVFYAYDLEDAGPMKAKVVFHVWGGKADVKEMTHSLGILRKDDASQGRWAMTFDDPKVLAQINSVFVTVESANKYSNEPHGKRVLYAYFGSQPNHP